MIKQSSKCFVVGAGDISRPLLKKVENLMDWLDHLMHRDPGRDGDGNQLTNRFVQDSRYALVQKYVAS